MNNSEHQLKLSPQVTKLLQVLPLYLNFNLHIQETKRPLMNILKGVNVDGSISFEKDDGQLMTNMPLVENNFLLYKPILRPHTDIFNEITHNGKVITPISLLQVESQAKLRKIPFEFAILDCAYIDVYQLRQMHFDLFGLLEKKVARDYNKFQF